MFYSQLIQLCEANHIKPSALARKLGFSPSAPGRWKNGSIPQSDTIQKLAEYFGVTTDFLLFGDSRAVFNSIGGDISGSAVVQGGSGNQATVAGSDTLSQIEAEVLRVLRSLDIKDQTAVLMYAYGLEEKRESK